VSRPSYTYRCRDVPAYRQATFDTKREKDEFVAEVRRRRRLGLSLSFELEEDVTLAVYFREYWRLQAVPHLEKGTRGSYEQAWLKWIKPHLGNCELHAISGKVITRQLMVPMRKAGAGDPTILYVLAVLQSVMAFAKTERISENPVAAVRKPARAVERDVPPVAPAAVERMRVLLRARHKQHGVRDALIVALIAYQGLRPEEVLALKVEDVGEMLRIRRKNVDGELLTYTKTRRKRSVPFTAAAVRQDIAAYQLATGIRRGLLFPRGDGEPWRKHDYSNWRGKVYQPIARKVGLPQPRPYDLRGSYVAAGGGRPDVARGRLARATAWTPASATTRRSSTTLTRLTGLIRRTRFASPASRASAASSGSSTSPRGPVRDVVYVSYTSVGRRMSPVCGLRRRECACSQARRRPSPPSDSNRKPLHYK
jgi:integrase